MFVYDFFGSLEVIRSKRQESSITQVHPYHLVSPSPWPIFISLSCGLCVLFYVGLLQHYDYRYKLHLSLFMLFYFLYCWGSDIIFEGKDIGIHTKRVQQGLRLGMLLFILSEVCFFFAFF